MSVRKFLPYVDTVIVKIYPGHTYANVIQDSCSLLMEVALTSMNVRKMKVLADLTAAVSIWLGPSSASVTKASKWTIKPVWTPMNVRTAIPVLTESASTRLQAIPANVTLASTKHMRGVYVLTLTSAGRIPIPVG